MYKCIEWKVFLIACVFDMQLDNMLQFSLVSVIAVTHYQRKLSNLPAIEHLPAQSQQ